MKLTRSPLLLSSLAESDEREREALNIYSKLPDFENFKNVYRQLSRSRQPGVLQDFLRKNPRHYRQFLQGEHPEGLAAHLHATYPHLSRLAHDFQTAVNGWNGQESEQYSHTRPGRAEAEILRNAASEHGLNPAYFLRHELAVHPSNVSVFRRGPQRGQVRRNLALQIARLHDSTWSAGDGRWQALGYDTRRRRQDWYHGRWTPQIQRIPSKEAANAIVDGLNFHMPELGELKTRRIAGRSQTPDSWVVNLTHRKLGGPYPNGSKEHAHEEAKRGSGENWPVHVVYNHDEGHYRARGGAPREGETVHATYKGKRRVG